MKVTQSQYLSFVNDYKSGIGDTRYQRFGQAFINKFGPGDGTFTDSELFYCNDDNKSAQLILEKYIDWGVDEVSAIP